jgi:hypothetical protein
MINNRQESAISTIIISNIFNLEFLIFFAKIIMNNPLN